MTKSEIKLDLTDVSVAANLSQTADAKALVIFVHGTGGSHRNANDNFVADVLNQNNINTIIVDLLTADEAENQGISPDIDLLKTRLVRLTEKVIEQFAFNKLPVGYFGIGSGVIAVFEAAAFLGDRIKAVVGSGGHLDLTNNLSEVKAPTLLISGSLNNNNIELNKKAYGELGGDKNFQIINGASDSFEEPGALNEVAKMASEWFNLYLPKTEVKESRY